MMKTKLIPALLLLILIASACSKPDSFGKGDRMPRVAFLTTGGETGTGELPAGVYLAQRLFNSEGMLFSIVSRDILFDPSRLDKFDLLIVSTAAGYHDADRAYSLSFMTDQEMQNLRNWVKRGGFLLAGDNIGRNYVDGRDRITQFGRLTSENWPLSEVLGVEMEERNMRGFRIEGDSCFLGELIMKASGNDEWVLVPTLIDKFEGQVKAWWKNDTLDVPAVVWNKYGKGQSILLPSSYLLHPANQGGSRSISQIETFYRQLLQQLPGFSPEYRLNPWPGTAGFAFSITLNSDGEEDALSRMKEFINNQKVPVTLIHTSQARVDTLAMELKGDIEFASGGFRMIDFNELNYPKSMQEIIQNNITGDKRYSGFRFPFRLQGYWGLMALENLGYKYESSIATDHLNGLYGSMHPYHLPISSKGYYTILNLLEIGPMRYDDGYFLSEVSAGNPVEMEKKSLLFESYLKRFAEEMAGPYRGVMVYSGTARFTFFNDTTMIPLVNFLIERRQQGDAWMATLRDVAERWDALERTRVQILRDRRKIVFQCTAPEGIRVQDLSIEFDVRPKSAKASKGNARIEERAGKYYVVFDAMEGQRVEVVRGRK